MPIGNAVNGKSTRANLPSADAADVQNTAARNVRKVPGAAIAFGASPLNLAMARLVEASDTIDMVIITARTTTIIIEDTAALVLLCWEGVNFVSVLVRA